MNAVREANDTSADKSLSLGNCGAEPLSNICNNNGSTSGVAQEDALDTPISDGPQERAVHDGMEFNSDEPNNDDVLERDSSVQPLVPGQLLSSVLPSVKKFLGDNILPFASESISSFFGLNEEEFSSQGALGSPSLETLDHVKEANDKISLKESDGLQNGRKSGLMPDPTENVDRYGDQITNEVQIGNKDGGQKSGLVTDCTEIVDHGSEEITNEVQIENKDDIESALEPQSILVLVSSHCIAKQMVCEQSHLSRIKYYGNFDVSLGRFLQDTLLNQKHICSSCGETPEAHVYRYTHQNGNLTVLVRHLPRESSLSGEAEGKIWMWTRCLKCKHESRVPKSTQRVVLSSAARGLSFGKFLDLSFSSHSASIRLSRCGHSLHRDCLRFFGLGTMVAMFRYSSVEIYAACMPPAVIEFCNPNGQEWLVREATDVLAKGDLFFREVANLMQKLKPRYCSPLLKHSINISGSRKEFNEVEEMMMKEKTEFEASLLKAINHGFQVEKSVHEILDLSWLIQELLLMVYVWDRRLHSILLSLEQSDSSNGAISEEKMQKDIHIKENGGPVLEPLSQIPIDVQESLSCAEHHPEDHSVSENELEIESAKISDHSTDTGCLNGQNSSELFNKEHAEATNDSEECIPISDHMEVAHPIRVTVGPLDYVEKAMESEVKTVETLNNVEMGADITQKSHDSKLEDPEEWIWAPFSELRKSYRKDLHGGFLQKFEFVDTYTPTYLSSVRQVITEVDSLHFPVGQSGDVISVTEDEISSIVACALALSENRFEKEAGVGKGEDNAVDNSYNLASDGSVAASHWSSTGSLEPGRFRSSNSILSISADELSTLGSDGSLIVDRLIASENMHPEITVGSMKASGKSKYSVVCIYAKQFYSLRRRCCPSELAYISSLSRCKKWDPQGGKSKAFFAKSMDDRLIIKQIKKPELESFLKFGPEYFKHVSLSLDSGSQTCLAKVLGIYQVRQYKSGKEVKVDLMVMENLLFGRNIDRKYDLKGAVFSRYVSDSNDPETVLLDENFVEDMRISPIYLGGKTKHFLQRAIWNDTSFLTSINVMDYSLLVGVDRQRHEIVFGIIDYLRQYTWDKQLETWVKASLVVPKNAQPTVVSPKEYKKRFRKFMTKYFLTVPDTWNSDQCSGSCKLCIDGSSKSSELHMSEAQDRHDLGAI